MQEEIPAVPQMGGTHLCTWIEMGFVPEFSPRMV